MLFFKAGPSLVLPSVSLLSRCGGISWRGLLMHLVDDLPKGFSGKIRNMHVQKGFSVHPILDFGRAAGWPLMANSGPSAVL